jgi:hypothetical protein
VDHVSKDTIAYKDQYQQHLQFLHKVEDVHRLNIALMKVQQEPNVLQEHIQMV